MINLEQYQQILKNNVLRISEIFKIQTYKFT